MRHAARSRRSRLALVLLAAVTVGGIIRGAADEGRLSSSEMLSFLVQCIGTSKAGDPAPAGRACKEGADVTKALRWRKHDWPNRGDPNARLFGHQASDSLAIPGTAFPTVVQSFDFGDGERRFRTFDGNMRGDGGDAVAILSGAAWIFLTEDGGNGRQWFVAEACRTGPRPNVSRESWLLFDDTVSRGEWRDRLARLTITRDPDDCPSRFSNAFTRYRRDTLAVPVRFVKGERIDNGRWTVDTIVSEHFGGRSQEAANHLERFFLGRHLGKYRWERWEALALSKERDNGKRAEDLARSGRCPSVAYSDPPASGWVMVDCRMWTNFVRQEEPWSYATFGWPGNALRSFGAVR